MSRDEAASQGQESDSGGISGCDVFPTGSGARAGAAAARADTDSDYAGSGGVGIEPGEAANNDTSAGGQVVPDGPAVSDGAAAGIAVAGASSSWGPSVGGGDGVLGGTAGDTSSGGVASAEDSDGLPGGFAGDAGSVTTAGATTGTTTGSTEPLGGYHVHGDWAGFAFVLLEGGATVSPENFENMIDQDGPYCIKGTVAATEEYTSIAAVGVNVSQPKVEDAPVSTLKASGTGLLVDYTVNGGENSIRIQIEGADVATNQNHRWCAKLTGSQKAIVHWEAFNTACWAPEDGVYFDPATDEFAKVIFYVPDAGPDGNQQSFDFCVNDVGPDDVTGRGTGEIVSSCGNNVSWGQTSVSGQYDNVASGDGKYRFQANGWNSNGNNASFTLSSSCGFKVDSQPCSQNGDSPCSFPSIYIGTSGDGKRTSGNGLPAQVSSIDSIPTCLGWSSGGTPASDEYSVSYDVWFNSNSDASYADTFLMVWLRDPPSYQPPGQPPVQNSVMIGSEPWSVWYGPNGNNQNVVSYVAPSTRADGQAYSFDLKDFIDDAVERGYLDQNKYLIAIMGGLEVWSGGQGASLTGFRAEVQ